MQSDAEPVAPLPPTPPVDEPRKKKKKKRKREMENGEKVRECVTSHLGASTQEEDWGQAGMWSLTPEANVGQSEEKSQRAAAASAADKEQRESGQKEPGQDSLKKKKKKKKLKMMQELQNPSSAAFASERWVDLMIKAYFKKMSSCPQHLSIVLFVNKFKYSLVLMFDSLIAQFSHLQPSALLKISLQLFQKIWRWWRKK